MADDSRQWIAKLMPFAVPDNRRAILEIIITFALLIAAWLGVWALMQVSGWLALLAAFPASLFMVRLFIIQHDCGHGALFTSRAANDWVGRVLGVFTLTPYDWWKHSHALHHASSGNLDKRGIGDIDTLTVEEYRARDWRGRLKYRAYRHPLVLFVIGPFYMFVLQHRLPVGFMNRVSPWVSTMGTNAGIILLAGLMIWFFGLKTFLLVHMPLVVAGASIGVWLFYVQHQFNPTFWEHAPDWQREEAALHGSSFYDLPKPLMWITGNIGIHHVHHIVSRIPFHRLPQTLKAFPELKGIGHLTFRDSLKCVRLTLWDEKAKKLLTFREFGALPA